MLETGTIRTEPTIFATDGIGQTWAVGMPARSSSLVSAAPQRVLVPHVLVRIAACTPLAFSSSAMERPIFFTFSRMLAQPEVEKKAS
jgi:hypothetical protein